MTEHDISSCMKACDALLDSDTSSKFILKHRLTREEVFRFGGIFPDMIPPEPASKVSGEPPKDLPVTKKCYQYLASKPKGAEVSYAEVAHAVGISARQCHDSCQNAISSGYVTRRKSGRKAVLVVVDPKGLQNLMAVQRGRPKTK